MWRNYQKMVSNLQMHFERFPNPHFVRRGKRVLPQLLDAYPTFTTNLRKEMDENLAHLSAEHVLNYINDTGIPNILRETNSELENSEEITKAELLRENRLTKISLPTV